MKWEVEKHCNMVMTWHTFSLIKCYARDDKEKEKEEEGINTGQLLS